MSQDTCKKKCFCNMYNIAMPVFPVLCSCMLHIVRDYILRLSALAAFLNLLSKCFVNTV